MRTGTIVFLTVGGFIIGVSPRGEGSEIKRMPPCMEPICRLDWMHCMTPYILEGVGFTDRNVMAFCDRSAFVVSIQYWHLLFFSNSFTQTCSLNLCDFFRCAFDFKNVDSQPVLVYRMYIFNSSKAW